ncbi:MULTISPECIES: PAS domain-containing protein [unclassified Devosia]|uniref:PAS domain-containing protein n=1 Tax=unclassified Devosia TaxID=196773 RepID=UPI0015580A4C|nr:MULTISPECIES: PAS domain-containing protein [unclassified Devosia]
MPRSLFPAASPEVRARLELDPTIKLINHYDWASNPLGPIPAWPESLKGAVRVMLATSTPMAMLIGSQGILIYNNAYAVFAGERHPHIFGLPAEQAWPEIAEFNRHKIDLGLRGETLHLEEQELLLNRNGTPEAVWLDLHYSPVLAEDGTPLAVLCIVQETTTRVLAERAVARSEERLSLALNSSTLVGTWDWDIVANSVTADEKFATMYNLDAATAKTGIALEGFMQAIHPEDVERVGVEIRAALADGSPFRSQYRLLGPDGTIRWVIASGRPRLGDDGNAIRFPGVVVDVTEQRRASDALAESELRFRTLTNAMPQMVWSTLPDGFHDYYNDRWYQFTGVPQGSTDGEGWNNLFHPDDQQRAWAIWRNSLETGEPYQIEYRLRHHTGEYRWTLGLALPIRDSQDRIIRWFGTLTDIHETKLAATERDLVAQELSHRIKNIFAVLTGIISLSARSQPEIKPFADQLRQRIFALSEAHDFVRPHSARLQDTEHQGSLWALIERLLQAYHREGTARVSFRGEDAPIDDGAATPLALLFHELGTNAAKYGALSVADGEVVLEGRVSEDGYHLSWKERGGPVLDGARRPEGFGSRLVSLSVEGQMRGKVERIWEADGLRVEVDLPATALRRSGRLQS